MRHIWKKLNSYINRNIGRKITFLMVPTTCIIMALTIIVVNHIYMGKYVKNLEEESQYVTDTFKMNMDFCTDDVKVLINSLSMDEDVKELVCMDMENRDYKKILSSERNMKKTIGSLATMKSYIQDICIVGNNGYQYNYLTGIKGNITETDWFQTYVNRDKKGFQYILPHKVDYYEEGRSPAKKAMSIVLSIKDGNNEIRGYVVCDLRVSKVAAIPDTESENANVQAYLINTDTEEVYDFQKERITANEKIMSYIGDKKSDFSVADKEFIVYSKMDNSAWCFAEVHLYEEIIASAAAAQKVGILMLFISCGMILAVARMISRFIKKPIDELIVRMEEVEQQNFEPVLIKEQQNQPGEIILIRKKFEKMTQQLNELIQKVYLDEIYQKNMQYENLVNQINPHFIYNVLQLIQAKAVLSENEEIDDIVVALSRLMRYTMSHKSKIVTVQEECNYIESYLELYQKRYSHKFVYRITIEEGLETYPILKFMIQPVVENCIKHGFKHLKKDGEIDILISHEKKEMIVRVKDNGQGICPEELEKLRENIRDVQEKEVGSIGLKNTYQRLKLTYGEKADMTIDSEEHGYTTVCCKIPYEEGNYVQDHVCG